jgi:hypothetical protein
MGQEASRDFLRHVARAFADAPEIGVFEDGLELAWERDGLAAGAGADGAWVFLAEAACEAHSPDEAVGLLRAIFADEIVAVAAFAKGAMVYCDLARADDVSAGLNRLDRLGAGDMPVIDEVWVRSWTGARDTGGPDKDRAFA